MVKFMILLFENIYYFIIYLAVHVFVSLLPEVKTDVNSFYNSIYLQKNFNSFHIDFSKLILFLLSVNITYSIYIKEIIKNDFNTIEVQEQENYLSKQKGRNFKKLLFFNLFGVFAFFFSGNSVLIGEFDYEGFCNTKDKNIINLHKSNKSLIIIR